MGAKAADGDRPVVYRSRPQLVIAAFFLALIGVLTAETATLSWPRGLPLLAMCCGLAFWVYWVFVRPKLVVGPQGVTIVNPRQVVRLRWAEIEKAAVVQWKLTFLCVDGRAVGAKAVSASAIGFMLGHRTYPDRVADLLNRRLVESRGESWIAVQPTYTVTGGELHRRRQAGVGWTLGVLAVLGLWLLVRSVILQG